MATKPSATAEATTPDQDGDTTLLDVQSVAVKRLIARGKERGYITFDELNAVLPPDQNASEQIEDVMANLSEMGIQVVEGEEGEDGETPAVKTEKAEEEGESEAEPTGNVDHEIALRIYRLFVELNRLGTTVIIATHDQDLVARSGRPVLHLDKGRLTPLASQGPVA